MERNKILFSGTSNTLGLGLEYEFRPKYNDHEWVASKVIKHIRKLENVYKS